MNTKTKEWVAKYYSKIGGSTSAAAVGLSRWMERSHLAEIMLGRQIPPDISDKPDVLRGVLCEPAAIHMLSRALDEPIASHDQDLFIESDAYPWAHITPDGWAGRAPVEVKCVRRFSRLRMERDGVPPEYFVQMQHGMAVLGSPCYEFGALSPEDMELFRATVPRDDFFIQTLMEAEREFWDAIQRGEIPGDIPRGSLFDAEPPTDKPVVLNEPEALVVAEHYLACRGHLTASEVEMEDAKARLMALIGDAQKFIVPTLLKGSHTTVAGRHGVDIKALSAAHPEIVKQYERIGNPYKRLTVNELA